MISEIIKNLLLILLGALTKFFERLRREKEIEHTVNLIENIKTPDDRDQALKALDDIFHDNRDE